jgi:hypothetical protein
MTGQMISECIREMGMRGLDLAHCIHMMLGM